MTTSPYIIVDQQDKILEYLPQVVYDQQSHLPHRSVYVLVWNQKGDLVLPRVIVRQDDKTCSLLQAVGGPVQQGESHTAAAHRYLRSYLGLQDARFHQLARVALPLKDRPEVATLYTLSTHGPFSYHEDQVESVTAYSQCTLRRLSWLGRRQLHPSLRALIRQIRKHRFSPTSVPAVTD